MAQSNTASNKQSASLGFEARHAALLGEDPQAAEDKDEYLADNIFWVPREGRWSHLKVNATLDKLRDTLLPRLIFGELRIADADKFIERAT